MEKEKKGSGFKVVLALIIAIVIFVGYATISFGSVKNFFNEVVHKNEKLEKFVDDIANEDLDKEFVSISTSLEEKYSKENKDKVEDPEEKAADENKSLSNDSSLNDEEIENFTIDIDSTVEVSGTRVTLKSSGIVDEKNGVEYLKSTLEGLDVTGENSPLNDMGLKDIASFIGSMNFSIEMYIDMNANKSYTKIPAIAGFLGIEGAGEWQVSQDISAPVDIKGLLSKLSEDENTEKIDDNTYKTYISGEQALKSMPSSIGDKKIDPNLFREDIPVIYTLVDGRISTISFDFSGMGAAAEMSFYVSISNYNQAGEVKIPDEVKK